MECGNEGGGVREKVMDRFQFKLSDIFWLTTAVAAACAAMSILWRWMTPVGEEAVRRILLAEWVAAVGCGAVVIASRRRKPFVFLLYPLASATAVAALFATIALTADRIDPWSLRAFSAGMGVALGLPLGIGPMATAWVSHFDRSKT